MERYKKKFQEDEYSDLVKVFNKMLKQVSLSSNKDFKNLSIDILDALVTSIQSNKDYFEMKYKIDLYDEVFKTMKDALNYKY